MLQNGKTERRTKVLEIGLMQRIKINLAIESWTAIFLKVYIYKLNIKLVFPESKLYRCKIANEKCKLQLAKCVVAKFQQTCRSSRS